MAKLYFLLFLCSILINISVAYNGPVKARINRLKLHKRQRYPPPGGQGAGAQPGLGGLLNLSKFALPQLPKTPSLPAAPTVPNVFPSSDDNEA